MMNEERRNSRPARIAAQVIRILSVPPVMVTLLIVILYIAKKGVFLTVRDALVTWLCLALVPAAAYPLSLLIPGVRRQGRDGQRKLAFLCSCAGYAAGFVYALVCGSGRLICLTAIYVLSVMLLLITNKLPGVRTSGHGCSVVGPLLFGSFCFGLPAFPLCAGLYGLILWASLYLKRHTPGEFLGGSAICLLSTGICAAVCLMTGLLP